MKRCHSCGKDVQGAAIICRYCDARLDPEAPDAEPARAASAPARAASVTDGPSGREWLAADQHRSSVGVGGVFRKVVWVFALLSMGFAALDGYFTIRMQTGAPQQAAAGAVACFQLIVPYVIARALDALTRD